MMWNNAMDGFGGFGMFFGPLFMIAIPLLILWFLVVLVRSASGSNNQDVSSSSPSPLDILKERYARGEIDEREYNERRKTLLK